MTNSLSDLLDSSGEPGLGVLREVLLRLAASGRGFVSHKLGRPHVYRVSWSDDRGSRSVVVKGLVPGNALKNDILIRRWLPLCRLEQHGPVLLAVAADVGGQFVWHIYEDLGDSSLSGPSAQTTLSEDENDQGFLSPSIYLPAPERVSAAVDVIAEIHRRFANHPVLAECRLHGGDLGAYFYVSAVNDARRALQALDNANIECALERKALLLRLLHKTTKLQEEQGSRTSAFARYGGPETLLHGDLSPRNVMVLEAGSRLHTRLIDWDHVGVGPVCFDLSNFLAHLPESIRQNALFQYVECMCNRGWVFSADVDWNFLFETSEYARLANSIIWRASALLENQAEWAFDDLVLLDQWFDNVRPVLPVPAFERR